MLVGLDKPRVAKTVANPFLLGGLMFRLVAFAFGVWSHCVSDLAVHSGIIDDIALFPFPTFR